jgi:hypothetical protein
MDSSSNHGNDADESHVKDLTLLILMNCNPFLLNGLWEYVQSCHPLPLFFLVRLGINLDVQNSLHMTVEIP